MAASKELDRESLATVLFMRAFKARLRGLADSAAEDLQACLELLPPPRSGTTAYTCFFKMAVRTELARLAGDYQHAHRYTEAAIALARLFCDYYTVAALLLDQAWFAYQCGCFADARALALSLLSLTQQIQAHHYAACGKTLLRRISISEGQAAEASTSTRALRCYSLSICAEAATQANTGQHSPLQLLSERELAVLHLVATGLSNAEIAARLAVRTGTVKKHLEHIFGKLDAHSRAQAVARARTLGLLP